MEKSYAVISVFCKNSFLSHMEKLSHSLFFSSRFLSSSYFSPLLWDEQKKLGTLCFWTSGKLAPFYAFKNPQKKFNMNNGGTWNCWNCLVYPNSQEARRCSPEKDPKVQFLSFKTTINGDLKRTVSKKNYACCLLAFNIGLHTGFVFFWSSMMFQIANPWLGKFFHAPSREPTRLRHATALESNMRLPNALPQSGP